MSRIGRMPIPLPANVTVEVESGGKRLQRTINPDMKIVTEEGVLRVERPSESREHRSLHGLTRTLVANMVTGVTTGFTRRLEINGVGYRAMRAGDMIMF